MRDGDEDDKTEVKSARKPGRARARISAGRSAS